MYTLFYFVNASLHQHSARIWIADISNHLILTSIFTIHINGNNVLLLYHTSTQRKSLHSYYVVCIIVWVKPVKHQGEPRTKNRQGVSGGISGQGQGPKACSIARALVFADFAALFNAAKRCGYYILVIFELT